MMELELSKEFTFEASHVLPKHPGKCSRLHGHSWVLTVYVKGEVNKETGFVMDYADIKRLVQPLVDQLDHRHLGTWVGPEHRWLITAEAVDRWFVPGLPKTFYPSSENLIVWIADVLTGTTSDSLPWSKLQLNETCTSSCILTREEYDKRAVGSLNNKGTAEPVK